MSGAYVYVQSERPSDLNGYHGLWSVGFFTPGGEWVPESDHASSDGAARRVHYLNGGGSGSDGATEEDDDGPHIVPDSAERIQDCATNGIGGPS